MAIPNTVLVGYEDPYTHVIIENIRLNAYATGGVNISVGELSRVIHAQVNPHGAGASGFNILSGGHHVGQLEFHVTSGSGNIVTIGAFWKGSQECAAGKLLSAIPLKVEAWGH